MNFPDFEITKARDLYEEATAQIEIEGRSVGAFSSAMLIAAAEAYAVVHGDDELATAFDQILRAQAVHLGTAGRA